MTAGVGGGGGLQAAEALMHGSRFGNGLRVSGWCWSQDFGAKGDGVTDDTSAIRAAFKAAHDYKQEKMTPNYHRKYGYFTTFPEVYFPSGHYIIHETIDISGPNIRGEGSAAIEQKEPEKDIFYCSSTWQRTIEGLTF